MIQPRKGYGRRVLTSGAEPKICANPTCGLKIPRKKVYCDRECRDAHSKLLKAERRPKSVQCANCGKELDTLKYEPNHWNKYNVHFCDPVCIDAYRRANGDYAKMSELGVVAINDFRKKTGKPHNYNKRAAATSIANKQAPPRAKHIPRSGKIWGYEVHFLPNEEGDGYIASIPELPEFGRIEVETKKAGLLEIRQRIANQRTK